MANVSIEIESRVLVTYKECEMIVGPGVRGNSIFKGFFNGNIPIAVKRCARTEENKEAKRDLEVLCSHDELRHPHIIRYFGAAMDNCFWYYLTYYFIRAGFISNNFPFQLYFFGTVRVLSCRRN